MAHGVISLRMLPLSMRKTNLERLLVRRPEGVFINPFSQPKHTAPAPLCLQ